MIHLCQSYIINLFVVGCNYFKNVKKCVNPPNDTRVKGSRQTRALNSVPYHCHAIESYVVLTLACHKSLFTKILESRCSRIICLIKVTRPLIYSQTKAHRQVHTWLLWVVSIPRNKSNQVPS